MTNRYTIEDKPKFKQNEEVDVDFGCIYKTGGTIRKGKIVGKVMENVVDFWIVWFEDIIDKDYPYTCCSIPHTTILKK